MPTNDHDERHGERGADKSLCVFCVYVETHAKISINTCHRINAADTRHTLTLTMLNAHISFMNLSIRWNEQKNKWNNYHMLLLQLAL